MTDVAGIKLRVARYYNSAPVIGSDVNLTALDRTKTTDYAGNKVYEDGKLKYILVDGGYVRDGKYYFYLTDHLGNNRAVVAQDGTSVQNTEYYPYGLPFDYGTGKFV